MLQLRKTVIRSLALGLVLVIWPGAVLAEHFVVVPGAETRIVFDSRAPMEKFQGKTGAVSGWLDADLDDLSSPVKLAITVDLASFDTGMSKRNKHMRENHFETEKFPTATFSGGQITQSTAPALAVGATVELALTGILDLHGVRHETACAVTLTRPTADSVQVTARFEVLLPDHRIKRPKFLVMKLAEDQQVTARILLQKES